MRARWTLSRKILCLALLNVVLLAAALLAVARAQFRFGPESLLLGPAHDRILGIAGAFAAELDAIPETARDGLVEQYRTRHHADFFLVSGRGVRIAGPAPEVDEELLGQIRRLLPPPGRGPEDGPGPPPPRRAPPPRQGPPRKGNTPRERGLRGSDDGFGSPDGGRRGPPPRNHEAQPPDMDDGFGPPAGGRRGPPPRNHEAQPPDMDDGFGPPAGGRRGPPPRNHEAQPPGMDDGFGPPQGSRGGGVSAPAAGIPAAQIATSSGSGATAQAGEEDGPPPRRGPLPPESEFLWVAHGPTRYWAGARIRSTSLKEAPGNLAILLIRSNSLLQSRLFFDGRLWFGVALTVIAVSVLCWLPFIRGLTRSIARMDQVTQQIAEGRFEAQAGGSRSDELGHLGQQIDRMAARLQSFVMNQKRFLGDIAHELCAPIARIQFALGILEQKAEEGQRRHVAALHEEIQEMSVLVNELLSFSKAGMHADPASLTPVEVAGVIEKAVARESFAGGSIEARVEPGMVANANEALLLRALSNVLRNAIRYAGAAGPIVISAERRGGEVEIVVADSGPGLPPAELEAVFAPFYRPEAARTRETGGAGLGLAIVRTCVEACGGTVSCRNRTPSGLEVLVRLNEARVSEGSC